MLDYDDGTGPAATVSKAVSGTGVATSVPALHGPWLALAFMALAGTAIPLCLVERARSLASL